jgi:hypothetical protein
MPGDLEKWLAEGDLTNDGRADEIVALVGEDPAVFGDVFACLQSSNPVVRGHAADALEKIGRSQPDLFLPHIDEILTILNDDPVQMVKWHLAMLLGHLAVYPQYHRRFAEALLPFVTRGKSFTRSWAITSLAILARLSPELQPRAVAAFSASRNSGSAAMRKRAEKALAILLSEVEYPKRQRRGAEGSDFPKGWVKSAEVRRMLAQAN